MEETSQTNTKKRGCIFYGILSLIGCIVIFGLSIGYFAHSFLNNLHVPCETYLELLKNEKYKESYNSLLPEMREDQSLEFYTKFEKLIKDKLGTIEDYESHGVSFHSSGGGSTTFEVVYKARYSKASEVFLTLYVNCNENPWVIEELYYEAPEIKIRKKCKHCQASIRYMTKFCRSCYSPQKIEPHSAEKTHHFAKKDVKIRSTYYSSGKLFTETEYLGSKRNGLSKEFYESGQLKIETPYKNGKKHGVERNLSETGKLISAIIYTNGIVTGSIGMSAAPLSKAVDAKKESEQNDNPPSPSPTPESWHDYASGKKDGIFKSYRSDGSLSSEIPYKGGKKSGTQKDYNSTGQLHSETEYSNNQKNGTYRRYYKSGRVAESATYVDNKLNGENKYYKENGVLTEIYNYRNDLKEGQYKHYHTSGTVSSTVFYKRGKKHGVQKNIFENGKLQSIMTYKNGLLEGHKKEYHDSGKIRSVSLFKNGKETGKRLRYSMSGYLWYETPYQNNLRHGMEKEYSSSGSIVAETYYDKGKRYRTQKNYYSTGELRSTRPYKNDKINYERSKRLKEVIPYKYGRIDGVRIYYNKYGKVEKKQRYIDGAKQS